MLSDKSSNHDNASNIVRYAADKSDILLKERILQGISSSAQYLSSGEDSDGDVFLGSSQNSQQQTPKLFEKEQKDMSPLTKDPSNRQGYGIGARIRQRNTLDLSTSHDQTTQYSMLKLQQELLAQPVTCNDDKQMNHSNKQYHEEDNYDTNPTIKVDATKNNSATVFSQTVGISGNWMSQTKVLPTMDMEERTGCQSQDPMRHGTTMNQKLISGGALDVLSFPKQNQRKSRVKRFPQRKKATGNSMSIPKDCIVFSQEERSHGFHEPGEYSKSQNVTQSTTQSSASIPLSQTIAGLQHALPGKRKMDDSFFGQRLRPKRHTKKRKRMRRLNFDASKKNIQLSDLSKSRNKAILEPTQVDSDIDEFSSDDQEIPSTFNLSYLDNTPTKPSQQTTVPESQHLTSTLGTPEATAEGRAPWLNAVQRRQCNDTSQTCISPPIRATDPRLCDSSTKKKSKRELYKSPRRKFLIGGKNLSKIAMLSNNMHTTLDNRLHSATLTPLDPFPRETSLQLVVKATSSVSQLFVLTCIAMQSLTKCAGLKSSIAAGSNLTLIVQRPSAQDNQSTNWLSILKHLDSIQQKDKLIGCRIEVFQPWYHTQLNGKNVITCSSLVRVLERSIITETPIPEQQFPVLKQLPQVDSASINVPTTSTSTEYDILNKPNTKVNDILRLSPFFCTNAVSTNIALPNEQLKTDFSWNSWLGGDMVTLKSNNALGNTIESFACVVVDVIVRGEVSKGETELEDRLEIMDSKFATSYLLLQETCKPHRYCQLNIPVGVFTEWFDVLASGKGNQFQIKNCRVLTIRNMNNYAVSHHNSPMEEDINDMINWPSLNELIVFPILQADGVSGFQQLHGGLGSGTLCQELKQNMQSGAVATLNVVTNETQSETHLLNLKQHANRSIVEEKRICSIAEQIQTASDTYTRLNMICKIATVARLKENSILGQKEQVILCVYDSSSYPQAKIPPCIGIFIKDQRLGLQLLFCCKRGDLVFIQHGLIRKHGKIVEYYIDRVSSVEKLTLNQHMEIVSGQTNKHKIDVCHRVGLQTVGGKGSNLELYWQRPKNNSATMVRLSPNSNAMIPMLIRELNAVDGTGAQCELEAPQKVASIYPSFGFYLIQGIVQGQNDSVVLLVVKKSDGIMTFGISGISRTSFKKGQKIKLRCMITATSLTNQKAYPYIPATFVKWR